MRFRTRRPLIRSPSPLDSVSFERLCCRSRTPFRLASPATSGARTKESQLRNGWATSTTTIGRPLTIRVPKSSQRPAAPLTASPCRSSCSQPSACRKSPPWSRPRSTDAIGSPGFADEDVEVRPYSAVVRRLAAARRSEVRFAVRCPRTGREVDCLPAHRTVA